MRTGSLLLFFFSLQVLPYCAGQEKVDHRAFVREVLKEERRDWSKAPWEEHAEKLKPLGDSAMDTLESFLTDTELGWHAS